MSIFDWLVKKPADQTLKKKEYEKVLPRLILKAERSSKKGDYANAAWIYQRVSVLARRAKEWRDGMEYAVLAAEMSEREGSRFNVGWSYRSAALAAKGAGDLEKTIEYSILGAESFKETGSIYAAKWCYTTAAEAAKKSGKGNDAIKLYERSRDIEEDDDTESEINRLKHSISHPRVDQYPDKSEVVEGDEVKFEVVVENHGKDTLTSILVGDKDARITHEIEKLKPGEVSIFEYSAKARAGVTESPYNFITWKDGKGDMMDCELVPASVAVRPRIEIKPGIVPSPVAGKACKLVIMIKSHSAVALSDIKIDLDFGESIDALHPGPKSFERLEPGEEYGANWSIRIGIPGRHMIAQGKVTFSDEGGTEFEERIREIIAAVSSGESPK